MSRRLKFEVGKQENLLADLPQAKVGGLKSVRLSKKSEIQLICIKHGANLIFYRFDVDTDSWKLHLKEKCFPESENSFNSVDYSWFVGDISGTGSEIIVVQNNSGLVFLQPRESPPGVDRYTLDTLFRFNSSTALIGNVFASDKSAVGFLFRNDQGGVHMFRTGKNSLDLQELPYLNFPSSWKQTDTKIVLTDLRGQGTDAFVSLTLKGLEIYEFDQDFQLIPLMRTKIIKRDGVNDTLRFGNFTNKKFKDIIHVNNDGLFLYQYNDNNTDVTLVNHSNDFTARYGSFFTDVVQIYDIDNDGIDELLFTGTSGLRMYSFNNEIMKWENSTNLERLPQYVKLIGLIKNEKNQVIVFAQDTRGTLQALNVMESTDSTSIPEDNPSKPLLRAKRAFRSSLVQPSKVTRISHHELPTMRWTEQWDSGFLKEAVRPQTGHVEFSIPLFKSGPIPAMQSAIGISYNSNEGSATLLGIGWIIPTADYYITVDHKRNLFPIDYDYFLIREGRKTSLTLKKIDKNFMEFEVVGQPELKVSYETSKEKWTVGNDVEEIVFGHDETSGATKIQLHWPNWKGSGTDTSKLEPFIHCWFLSKRHFFKTDSTVYYNYETSSARYSEKAYTTSIRLIGITDNKEFNINFEYSLKTESEFKILSPVNTENVITFPLQLVQSHYLNSCAIQTSTYGQKLDFNYELRNGKRLLVQISQPIKGNAESIFTFGYKEDLNTFVMSTCKFMKSTQLTFDYTKTESMIPPFSLQYRVDEHPQITFGSDYAVMAYKKKTAVEFRLTNRALTTPIFKGTTFREWSNGIVESFVVTAFQSSFVISQTVGFQVVVFTFSKSDDDSWSETPSVETFHQESLIRYSETFYVVAEPNTNKLIINQRDLGQRKWKRLALDIPGNVKLNRMQVQNYLIVGIAENQLISYHKAEPKGEWIYDVIDRDEIFRFAERAMPLFDVDSDAQKQIISTFLGESLQLFKNMIAVSGLQVNGDGDLVIVARLYLLDSNRKTAKTIVERVQREIKIVKESGRFLLDPKLFKIQLCKDGLFIGEDTFLRITGTEWRKVSRLPRDYVRLGESFVLGFDQKDTRSVYFHHQKSDNGEAGTLIKHIKLNGPGQFINRYPAYLAYQPAETSSTVVQTFKDAKTLGKEVSYTDEELLHTSDLTNLMTVARVGSHYEWRVRSLSNFMDKKFSPVVEKWSIANDGDGPRTTAYERSSKYKRDERVVEEMLRIIPGGDKKVSGWIEHVLVNNMETAERTSTTKYYDTLGTLVSVEERDAKNDAGKKTTTAPNNQTPSMQMQIFDKTGHLEISNFAPYSVSNDEGVYFGFESYEENQGVEFDEASIVRGQFAFTGESHLNLQRNAKLRKTLRPKDTNNIFIASCFIRSNSTDVVLQDEVRFLRAIVEAKRMQKIEILSKMLRQSGEWLYLESYIDLISLSRQYGRLEELRITIEITSDSADYIDLDHIRFSPLTQNFEAAVFDSQTGKVTARIADNGLVSRTIFDRHNREIASIKNNEEIEHFTRATKTGEIFPPPITPIKQQPSSKLKFEPESGFYEFFDATAFLSRWSISDDRVWAISKSQLIHRGVSSDTVTVNDDLIDESCAAIRFGYNLRLLQSALTLRWSSNIKITFISLIENEATLTLNANRSTVVSHLPVSGELLIFIEVERVVVWIDGVLIIDQGHGFGDGIEPWSEFRFEMMNYLVIEDLLIMNRPRISLEYFNTFGEKVQSLQFESDKMIQVSHTLYDELGRRAINTKTTKISRSIDQTLFAFYPEFVHNGRTTDANSVWNTGVLKGDVDVLNKDDSGVPFFRTTFANNPLNTKSSEGLPGQTHSVNGPFAKHFKRTSQESFMTNLFPTSLGYEMQAEILPNESEMISVVDESTGNIIARYTRMAGSTPILSTFEYDDNMKLVKILPPLYHEIAGTVFRAMPWEKGSGHLTQAEMELQLIYGSHFKYDTDGRLIEKRTPDTETVKYMYTRSGSLRFIVTGVINNSAKRVTYFFYDEFQQLVRTGHLSSPISLSELQSYTHGDWLPNAVDYQLIQYSDENPIERGLMKSIVTYNTGTGGSEPVKEIIRFNDDFDVSSRQFYGLPKQISFDNSQATISVRKEYKRKRVSALVYPGTYKGKPFKLIYKYNKLGNVVAIGTADDHKHFASITYQANGLVATETHLSPTSDFTFYRLFKYNSPGYLEQISDPFLTEDISYSQEGYGMDGFGDATVLLTAYTPKWANIADHRLFRVHDADQKSIPTECVDALKRLGYLDSFNNPKRMYMPDVELSIPLSCRGEIGLKISVLLAEKHVPLVYGYRFAYGNYKEVVNGKYFTNETHPLIEPLQELSFSKYITGLSKKQSQEIFYILTSKGFISTDRRIDIGRQNEPFFRDTDLQRDLMKLSVGFAAYSSVIVDLLTTIISQRKSISLDIFRNHFIKWQSFPLNIVTDSLLQTINVESQAIFEMLMRNGYMTRTALKADFVNSLSKYNSVIPEIVGILNHHFLHALGTTPFDVESYGIDANGNHRVFATGFERYEFAYNRGTNQIAALNKVKATENVAVKGKTYKMEHDIDGNVVKAPHKSIDAIEYNLTSQNPTSIRMSDGRKIIFDYDAQGERILKRVVSPRGDLNRELFYIRDDERRVLLERQVTYFPGSTSKETIVTMYIHGPRGLIGFIRNDKYYSVITDHAGSVRLIVRDGQVVAAFDYLPYGKIMRIYYSIPQDLIAYRFAGQEFDEETGLYNYNARLYDPDIGRFYQIDPEAPFYSPYKYAENTMVVESDKESAIKTTGASTDLAVSEAYFGGSAMTGRWNPVDQNFRDSGAYIGVINGASPGALLPVGVGQTMTPDPSGIMYLNANDVNGAWDVSDWQWDNPQTWNGFYEGFATGVSPFSGSVSNTASGMTYPSGVMVNTGNAAFWEWDLTNADTWNSILSGFDSGSGVPFNFVNGGRSIRKLAQKPDRLESLLSKVDQLPESVAEFDAILKDPRHPLYKVAILSATANNFENNPNGDFTVANFDAFRESSKGVFFARDTNERITTAMTTRKQPKPDTPPLISFPKTDGYRVRRFAMVPDDLIRLPATLLNVTTTEQTTVTHSQKGQGIASGSSRITFWPLNLFRTIKSKVYHTLQYAFHGNKPDVQSEPISLLSHQSVTTSYNYRPDILGDNFSFLEMGDQWLVNTNMQGNLLWSFVLLRKLFGYRLHTSQSSVGTDDVERIVYDLKAYDIVNEFFKYAVALSHSCGIDKIIEKILDSGDLDHLYRSVKLKLVRHEYDEISKLLFDSLAGRYRDNIRMMSSSIQAYTYEEKIWRKILKLNDRLVLGSLYGSESATLNLNQTNVAHPISNCLTVKKDTSIIQSCLVKRFG